MAVTGRVVRAGAGPRPGGGWRRSGSLIAVGAVLLASSTVAAQRSTTSPQDGLDCDRCHAELELLRQQAPTLDRARALLVPQSLIRGSAHEGMACAECHRGFGSFPHSANRTGTRSCASCHAAADSAWSTGAHATAPAEQVAACESCHTVHEVATAEALLAERGAPALNARCIACHQSAELPAGDPHAGQVACATCHAPHDVRPIESPDSRLARTAQSATCGACHEDVAASYGRDAHGTAVRGGHVVDNGNGEPISPPTCTTCHGGHGMSPADEPLFANEAGEQCAHCHESYGEEFLDSYHGQAVALGGTAAATCSDCHTSHAVFPAADPRSSVSEENLIETCAGCHPAANASFAQFQPHADPHDREGNPVLFWTYTFMTLLLFGVLSVFGLHTLLWVVRLAIEKVRGGPAHGHGEGGA